VTGDQRVLGDVYFIPNLHNIIFLGQLDEHGCKITICDGVMGMLDRPRKVLARVNRTRVRNRLYAVRLLLATPVARRCMALAL
jgi:hypothetical protein